MTKARISSALLSLFLTAWSNTAYTNDDLFAMSIGELLDVTVVTASKREQNVEDVAASVTILTRSDLALLGFNTLHDAMEYVVGVSAVSGENNIWHGYSIRGDTVVNYNTRTLLLIDGLRVHNPLFGSFDLTSLPLNAIEKVEVIKGAKSVMYGSNAVNAVINVITRKPQNGKGELIARAGEFGGRYYAGSWTTELNDWTLSGFAEDHSTNNQTQEMNSERAETVSFNKWLDNHSAMLKASKDNLQLHAMFHRRAQPNFLTRNFAFVRETDVRANLLGLKYRYDIHPQWQAAFQVSRYAWQADRDFFGLSDNVEDLGMLTEMSYDPQITRRIYYDSRLTDWLAELAWSPSDTLLWKWGTQYSDSYGRRYQTNRDDFDIGRFKDKTRQVAAFTNLEWQITEDVRAYAGIRWDDYDYTFTGTDDSADFSDLSKEASLVWQLNERHTVKLVYGESFRVPTYFEKEANTASTVGNPSLEPEYSETIDLILVRSTEAYTLDIGLFRTTVDGNIRRGNAPDGRRQNQNFGETEVTGVESNLRWQLKEDRLYGFAGFGIYEGENHEVPENQRDLRFTYDYMLTAGGQYQVAERLALTASLKHLSDWGDAPGYTLFNLGLRTQFALFPDLTLTADISNVLDEDVLLPEVSRESPEVPYFPHVRDSRAQLGLIYRF